MHLILNFILYWHTYIIVVYILDLSTKNCKSCRFFSIKKIKWYRSLRLPRYSPKANKPINMYTCTQIQCTFGILPCLRLSVNVYIWCRYACQIILNKLYIKLISRCNYTFRFNTNKMSKLQIYIYCSCNRIHKYAPVLRQKAVQWIVV